MEKTHSDSFCSAVEAVIAYRCAGSNANLELKDLRGKLRSREHIHFVDRIDLQYKVNGTWILEVPEDFCTEDNYYVLVNPRSSEDFYDPFSRAISEIATDRGDMGGALAEEVYRILRCDRDANIQTYLRRKGIPWSLSSDDSFDELEEELFSQEDVDMDDGPLRDEAESGTLLGISEADSEFSEISEELITSQINQHDQERGHANSHMGTVGPIPIPVGSGSRTTHPARREFAPLEEVEPEWVDSSGEPISEHRQSKRLWVPPSYQGRSMYTPRDSDYDKAIGKRGEEIVYLEELRRVEALGYNDPESVVNWRSKDDEYADHDIVSIDDGGKQKWIEVKSTVGTEGAFGWSHSEFRLAVEKRDQYSLLRVYRAASYQPVIIEFNDPVQQWREGRIHLDPREISGRVESL